MTFPTISAGTRANEAVGEYDDFVEYLNALSTAVDANTTSATGAALKANNLSDLASASTARTNLGLGDAATRDVGTGSGTVAAGDDSRLSDARTPTDGSVSTVKIADGAVTDAKLASKKAPRTALWLPGASGNYVSAPHSAAFASSDLDIRWFGSLADWTPASDCALVSRYDSGSTRSWVFTVQSGSLGRLGLYYSTDGVNLTAVHTATVATPFADGAYGGVRVTLDGDNGAGGHTVVFYTSTDDGATWVQLGAAVVTAGTITPFNATSKLELGSAFSGGAYFGSASRCRRVEVRTAIGGTVVASPDFTAPMGPRLRDAQGNIWTINGSAWAWEQS